MLKCSTLENEPSLTIPLPGSMKLGGEKINRKQVNIVGFSVPKKDRKTVIDLLSETMGPSELRKQKNIWKIFGHNDYYAAEKEKQEAIYEELQRKKFSPPSPLGG